MTIIKDSKMKDRNSESSIRVDIVPIDWEYKEEAMPENGTAELEIYAETMGETYLG